MVAALLVLLLGADPRWDIPCADPPDDGRLEGAQARYQPRDDGGLLEVTVGGRWRREVPVKGCADAATLAGVLLALGRVEEATAPVTPPEVVQVDAPASPQWQWSLGVGAVLGPAQAVTPRLGVGVETLHWSAVRLGARLRAGVPAPYTSSSAPGGFALWPVLGVELNGAVGHAWNGLWLGVGLGVGAEWWRATGTGLDVVRSGNAASVVATLPLRAEYRLGEGWGLAASVGPTLALVRPVVRAGGSDAHLPGLWGAQLDVAACWRW